MSTARLHVSSRDFELTDTVEAQIVNHCCNVLRILGPRGFIFGSLGEASGIAPSTNGDHDLGVGCEALTHIVDSVKGSERRVAVELLGWSESHDGVCNALGLVTTWEINRVVSES